MPTHLAAGGLGLCQQGRLLLALCALQVVHLLAQLGQLALQLLLLLQLLAHSLLRKEGDRAAGPDGGRG